MPESHTINNIWFDLRTPLMAENPIPGKNQVSGFWIRGFGSDCEDGWGFRPGQLYWRYPGFDASPYHLPGQSRLCVTNPFGMAFDIPAQCALPTDGGRFYSSCLRRSLTLSDM